MQQLVFIHGGETYGTYEEYVEFLKNAEYDPREERAPLWKDTLGQDLGEGWDVLTPSMPSKYNAKYGEWKIWFEKVLPHLSDGVIFVGWSLGGIFLVKYLAEETVSVDIRAVHVVSAPFDDSESEYSLADFVLPESLTGINDNCKEVHFYHSKDDFVVPFGDVEKYQEALPEASFHIFSDRNHFLQETFPELLEYLRRKAH